MPTVERKVRNDGSGIPESHLQLLARRGSALNLNTWYFIPTEEAGYTVLVYEGASLNGTKCATCVPFHATPSSTNKVGKCGSTSYRALSYDDHLSPCSYQWKRFHTQQRE
jgi:hypothetical protein